MAVWAGQGIALARGPGPPLSPWRCRGHRPDRLGDNDGMASDDTWALARRLYRMVLLDGARPSRGRCGGVAALLSPPSLPRPPPGPGTGPLNARQRALAEWAGATGFGLIAWGLGTEAPTAAEVQENIRQQIDLMRKPGTKAPATPGTQTPTARRIDRFFRASGPDLLVSPVAWMVIGVPWRLRHPRRLTVLAIAMEAPNVVFYVVRAAWAVQRRRPRITAQLARPWPQLDR